MLMDGVSQRSYVTNRDRESLSLSTEGQQKMLIKMFESEQEERVCDVVRIGLKTVGGANLELPFFSVPLICEPLSYHQPIAFCKATYDL